MGRVRRIQSSVRWAFRSTVDETEFNIETKNFKRLCDHCQVKNGPNCPRKNQLLLKYHQDNMIAVICDFFYHH